MEQPIKKIDFVVCSKTQGEKYSSPNYKCSSPLELFDRLMRCRSRKRIDQIAVFLAGVDSLYMGILVSNYATPATNPEVIRLTNKFIRFLKGEVIPKVITSKIDDPEYLEELSTYCWNTAIKLLEQFRQEKED